MEAYSGFASVYDLFMEDVDYDSWIEYIKKIWEMHGLKPELVTDLGCGTGTVSVKLAKEGYDVIGIDSSVEMLDIASEKASEAGLDILFLNQEIPEFELYGTVDSIICLMDTMNYITDEADFISALKWANNYLNFGGLFIFDVNTEYKFKNILGSNTFSEVKDEAAYIWENTYDEAEKINEYYVNFFVKNESGSYDRIEECHYERAYSRDEIEKYIEMSGLKLLDVFDAYTFDPPKENSSRLFFVAEKGSIQKER